MLNKDTRVKTFTHANDSIYTFETNSVGKQTDKWIADLKKSFRTVKITHMTQTTRKHRGNDYDIYTDLTVAVEVAK